MYSWVRFSHLILWSGGHLRHSTHNDFHVTSISTDSRGLKPGEVFAAVPGERFDGHDFIKDAVANGASGVIADREVPCAVPLLIVDKVVPAMARIGQQLREHFTGGVVGVTGSAGKSSTKEAIATLLGPDTVKSPASFNNLLGVSKTSFLLLDSTKNLVLEMGMNAFGEIKELCEYFKPQFGLISNIGDAHIGKLGGKDGIYKAKKELFDHLASFEGFRGVAVNQDDPMVVKAYKDTLSKKTPTVTYSATGKSADVSAIKRSIDPSTAFLFLTLKVKGDVWMYELPVFGLHHAENVVAAVSAALLMGVKPDVIRSRVQGIQPAYHRGEIFILQNGATLIDESYNSNPSALTSSLESLALLERSKRRVLIVGGMRELGEFSKDLHEKAGDVVASLFEKIPFHLVAVGEETAPLVSAVTARLPKSEVSQFKDVSALLPKLSQLIRTGDVCFVKGSRGIQLDKAVDALKAKAAAGAGLAV